jgi:predicted ATPase/DNA-binding XRE family transcriptional regulator
MMTDETRPDLSPSTFGPLLRRLRADTGLTQEELAERAGVSARLVSDLERGTIQRPRRDTIRMLADGLGLKDADRDAFTAVARGAKPAPVDEPRRVNLPAAPSPLIGRDRELAAVTSLLIQPEVRLLTLTGPGGVGKTRLALAVVARVVDAFPDGLFFVDLAPVIDPTLVLSAIAQMLGVRASGDRPLRDDLVAHLGHKRLCLLLDNLEHLAPVAPAIADLLSACSELTILATSRQSLHIRAEREYQVAPLALPDLRALPSTDELADVPAVALFVRQAEAARRSFALTDENARTIGEIAVRLDGLPLAIELAAAWTKVLSPAALLARLDHRLPLLTGGPRDLPARLQTVRAAIAWSYDLLIPGEQRVLRCLAVFVGGCTLDAAESVAGPSASDMVLDVVASLVDKSLIRVVEREDVEPRFGMLETIREYGLERLAAAGEELATRSRHAAWYLSLAERAEPELTGRDQEIWFSRLETDHDNLRAALSWGLDRQDGSATVLAGKIFRFWATLGHYEEGRRWLERAIEVDNGATESARAHARIGAGVMAYFQGDYAHAAMHTEAALATFRTLNDLDGAGSALGNLGLVADAAEDYPHANALYEEALAIFRVLGDQTRIGYMLNNLGLIAQFQGDYDRAAQLHQEALDLRRRLGDPDGIAFSLGNLGLVAFARGDYVRAEGLQRETLRLRRTLSNKSGLARCYENLALIAAATREPERATRLFAAADALRSAIGAELPPNDRAERDQCIAELRRQLGSVAFTMEWETGSALSPDEATDYALDRDSLAATGDLWPPPDDDRAVGAGVA